MAGMYHPLFESWRTESNLILFKMKHLNLAGIYKERLVIEWSVRMHNFCILLSEKTRTKSVYLRHRLASRAFSRSLLPRLIYINAFYPSYLWIQLIIMLRTKAVD
jgi:hypothetical protein